MKKLTKLAAAAITGVALLIGTNVNAQTTPASKLRFGVGLETGVPTGNAHTGSNFELGGTARLQYGTSDHYGASRGQLYITRKRPAHPFGCTGFLPGISIYLSRPV